MFYLLFSKGQFQVKMAYIRHFSAPTFVALFKGNGLVVATYILWQKWGSNSEKTHFLGVSI